MRKTILRMTVALVAMMATGTNAQAQTSINYTAVFDQQFDAWAKSIGYYSGFSAVSEALIPALQWLHDNTDAKWESVTYPVGYNSWPSPASGSDWSEFFPSLDNYSNFEDNNDPKFLMGWTGKIMKLNGRNLGAAATPKSEYSPTSSYGGCAVTTNRDGNDAVKRWTRHELGHLVRDDGFHHTDGRNCTMIEGSTSTSPHCTTNPDSCKADIDARW